MADGAVHPSAMVALAAALRGCQADLVHQDGDGVAIEQVGPAVLAEPFPMPVPGWQDPVAPRGGEATIETFVVDQTGSAEGTGGDQAVITWWQPLVEAMVPLVVAELGANGVELGDPIYVTASATTLDQVTALAHLDDDHYHPGAGPGLVAIAATHRGPRLARGRVPAPEATAGVPLGLGDDALSALFDSESAEPAAGVSIEATESDRLVLFPRFGQLHAGPTTAADGMPGDQIRNLLVLRADTVPVQAREGSSPT